MEKKINIDSLVLVPEPWNFASSVVTYYESSIAYGDYNGDLVLLNLNSNELKREHLYDESCENVYKTDEGFLTLGSNISTSLENPANWQYAIYHIDENLKVLESIELGPGNWKMLIGEKGYVFIFDTTEGQGIKCIDYRNDTVVWSRKEGNINYIYKEGNVLVCLESADTCTINYMDDNNVDINTTGPVPSNILLINSMDGNIIKELETTLSADYYWQSVLYEPNKEYFILGGVKRQSYEDFMLVIFSGETIHCLFDGSINKEFNINYDAELDGESCWDANSIPHLMWLDTYDEFIYFVGGNFLLCAYPELGFGVGIYRISEEMNKLIFIENEEAPESVTQIAENNYLLNSSGDIKVLTVN